jgi:ketosteroid isomerase-like protein
VVGVYVADIKTLIKQAYSAFNKRDIDGALALMTEDVLTVPAAKPRDSR